MLKPKVPVKRLAFHEITPEGIQRALEHPREVDMELVEAQEARRVLDRLYGYEVSPVLWRKVASGLRAGRVQSIALRLVVDRERERMAFQAAEFWDVRATFAATIGPDAGASSTPASPRWTASASRRARTLTTRASSRRTPARSHVTAGAAGALASGLADADFPCPASSPSRTRAAGRALHYV